MKALNKFLGAFNLNGNDEDDSILDEDMLDDEDDIYDEDDDLLDEPPKKKYFEKFGKSSSKKKEIEKEEKASKTSPFTETSSRKTSPRTQKNNKITPMRGREKAMVTTASLSIIKPSSMESAEEIANTLLDGSIVVLNLEGVDMELAQRLSDFSNGACYALGGSFKNVSNYIFVFAPEGVEITEDIQKKAKASSPSASAKYSF